ncbi:unnamed protein product [Rhodiola kirilowii]
MPIIDYDRLDVEYGVDDEKEVVFNGGCQKTLRRSAHSLSASLLRRKSDPKLVPGVRFVMLRLVFENFQEVILRTKLFLLFLAVPLAIVAQFCNFNMPTVFALSLVGLVPLAERVSFLTEQITYYTGPTVGGLLNATCGNATELIIAMFALHQRKIIVLKYSLLGSIISNLLLVLGTSLLCGGLVVKEQRFDRKQADVNSLLLLVALLCHVLPLVFRIASVPAPNDDSAASATLLLSRACSIMMLLTYGAYLYFQLKSHRQLFEQSQQEVGDAEEEVTEEDKPAIGFWSATCWLVGMTAIIALLSEYVVGTIEAASDSWGVSMSFIGIIVLPIVGNAAEHAGAIIFALKNKLDISLGVALGSATQISMFVVPLCVLAGWIMGIHMDLDLNLLETSSLAFSIIVTALTIQDGQSHYMKGVVLLICYLAISASFFVHK